MSKDSGSSIYFPHGSDDGNCLELSLGLSYNVAEDEGREAERSKAMMMESPYERARMGMGASGKPKQGRPNGLDAALKRFLEGRLEEQDEYAEVLDKYSPNYGFLADGNKNTLKGEEAPRSTNSKGAEAPVQATQEKISHSDVLGGKETLGVSNDTDIPATVIMDAATSAWSQLQEQDVPAYLIDAWKNQETSCSPLQPILNSGNEDPAKHDSEKSEQRRQLFVHWQILDQQRKFQEARKKRKNVIEEQKQQKQSKKEDDDWACHHGNDAEKLLSENKETTSKEKVFDIDKDENSETLNDWKESDVNPLLKSRLYRQFTAETTDSEKDKYHNETWKQEAFGAAKYKSDMIENIQENRKIASTLSMHRLVEAPYATSPRMETGKSSCQNSSTGSQSFEKREIHSGEISSAVPVSDTASGSSQSPMVFTSALPYTCDSSLSAVPMPQSLPVPFTNSSSMSFPVGFPFPYLLQFVPPSEDSNPALHVNPFQFPVAQGYLQYPIPPLASSASWIPALHPPIASSLFGQSSGVAMTRTATGIIEEGKGVQGTIISEIQIPDTSTAASMQGSDLTRTVSLRHPQDPVADPTQLWQGADSQLLSLLPDAAAGRLNSRQYLPDSGECSVKEQVGGFHPPTVSLRPLIKTSSLNGEQEQALTGKNVARYDDAINKGSNYCEQEETGHGVGNLFQRGSTENLSNIENLSPELLGIRQGIGADLKFGGTGSCPDLPWVSTMGIGHTGKTISGVLYRCSSNQVRIVCACHGKHMLPEEFIHHASDLEETHTEKRILGNSVPFTNQVDSVKGSRKFSGS